MDEKKKVTFWEALGRLPLREQIAIFIGFIAIVTAAVGSLFYLMLSRTSMVDFKLPAPELQSDGTVQSYKLMTYTDLNILVQFPNTDYAVYVGKEEGLYNNYAAAFDYDEHRKILVGVCDKEQPIADLYNYAISSVLEDGGISAPYSSLLHKEGYLNTHYVVYDAGSVALSKTYYIVGYLYDTGKEYLFMAVAFDKPEKVAAFNALTLLNKVYFTLSKISGDAAAEVSVSTDSASNAATILGSANISSADGASDGGGYGDSEKTATDIVEGTMLTLKERAYQLEYPDATDLEEMVFVSEDYSAEKTVIYIWYSEAYAVPREAYLLSPSGLKYAPTYTNESSTGMVYWVVDGPQNGFWTVHLSANIKYGTYSLRVTTKENFDASFGEHTETFPKDPD